MVGRRPSPIPRRWRSTCASTAARNRTSANSVCCASRSRATSTGTCASIPPLRERRRRRRRRHRRRRRRRRRVCVCTGKKTQKLGKSLPPGAVDVKKKQNKETIAKIPPDKNDFDSVWKRKEKQKTNGTIPLPSRTRSEAQKQFHLLFFFNSQTTKWKEKRNGCRNPCDLARKRKTKKKTSPRSRVSSSVLDLTAIPRISVDSPLRGCEIHEAAVLVVQCATRWRLIALSSDVDFVSTLHNLRRVLDVSRFKKT